ncbi:hypothetical protein LS68_006900 [Helicobacter sp. MIT 05-5293]|uniref:hypothetical protein n=1 Tax=Helicobacter sp. MIT 05-5293 TaxID=1548149 RepID=UPI00051CD0FB|nr:hypothetical protein [Helicobacter sp. MIT 05-5293]TLD80471.1 hypothetical protein LS68_006900 [Helicobacter sp. MIT 05-5293]
MKKADKDFIKRFDLWLLQGLPKINNDTESKNAINHKRLKIYKYIFNLGKIFALLSFCCGILVFLVGFDERLKNKDFLIDFLPCVNMLGILFFACCCVVYIFIFLNFISFRITKQIPLNNVTPYSKVSRLIKFFMQFFSMIAVVVLCLLGIYVHIGFFSPLVLLCLTPQIKCIYIDEKGTLHAGFVTFFRIPIGLYPIKNDESLYYCEYYQSQSTIPCRCQQLTRCIIDDEYIIKLSPLGFATHIDSARLIKILANRAILQENTKQAQNNKINIRDYHG